MRTFRAFRNDDPPALVDLWNRGLPDRNVVKPLTVHEFDALVMSKPTFDRAGLIVAEDDGVTLGFAHAGFGPIDPAGPSHRLDPTMGAVVMLAVDPARGDAALESELLRQGETYLRSRGAQVLYAGGQYPLNPFYWGLYGGSEFAGVLADHAAFHRAARSAGYEPVARTLVYELDLLRSDPRDPRLLLLRRQARVEVLEDVPPTNWWEAQAIGLFRPVQFRVLSRDDERELARATTWEIASGYGVGDGRPRSGLINLLVHPEQRRQGFAQLLIHEIARNARDQLAEVLAAQTAESNLAARALYEKLGFHVVDTATLYRRPADA